MPESSSSRGARHAARKRIRERERANCPHPEKLAYDLNDTREAMMANRMVGPTVEIYRCRCGYWHLATKRTRE